MQRRPPKILIICESLLVLALLTGCHHEKSKSMHRSERIEESEPRMVAPADTLVE